ncbi:Sensors of blue-light using FAD family [Luminiphilus syltensis NOR5-1B]|uniref:Sensors of blue-light using FAD family n=1 Tax=Luminiphilus syltensis NOR5-1B TaxID=565045 RepID=B8KT47_9GAMM|nr:BLUF domain-containing protein [Luminiphilus syltensis]EED36533.1 Sensors of blue-light using FAD family [Luminiphilus syltensis NOR5-1B]
MSEQANSPCDTLLQVGYVSTESAPIDSLGLLRLLTRIRERNNARGLTGLLLHRDDSFFQVLEGPPDAVETTMHEIEADTRHHNVRILFKETISEREFGDWQMGFLQLDGVDMSKVEGFSSFLHNPEQPQSFLENLSQSKRLALLFRELS